VGKDVCMTNGGGHRQTKMFGEVQQRRLAFLALQQAPRNHERSLRCGYSFGYRLRTAAVHSAGRKASWVNTVVFAGILKHVFRHRYDHRPRSTALRKMESGAYGVAQTGGIVDFDYPFRHIAEHTLVVHALKG